MAPAVRIRDARTGADLGTVAPWLARELSAVRVPQPSRSPYYVDGFARDVRTDETALVIADPSFGDGARASGARPLTLEGTARANSGARPSNLAGPEAARADGPAHPSAHDARTREGRRQTSASGRRPSLPLNARAGGVSAMRHEDLIRTIQEDPNRAPAYDASYALGRAHVAIVAVACAARGLAAPSVADPYTLADADDADAVYAPLEMERDALADAFGRFGDKRHGAVHIGYAEGYADALAELDGTGAQVSDRDRREF